MKYLISLEVNIPKKKSPKLKKDLLYAIETYGTPLQCIFVQWKTIRPNRKPVKREFFFP
jgi:hypothetical protein